MRFLITFAVTFFCVLSAVHASNTHTESTLSATPSKLASQSLLLDITKVGESQLIAVGHHGHIIHSTDGIKWHQANVPVQVTLTSVYFVDEKLGWAVGHDATILHSSDGGLNWQVQQYFPELEKPLLDVHFKNAEQGIAIGAYGMFYRTLDGGDSWQSEFHQAFLPEDDIEYLNELITEDEEAYLDEIAYILPHFNRIERSGDSTYLIGEVGLLAKSDDYGLTWQPFENFYQGSFFDLSVTPTGQVFVAGLRGHVFSLKNNAESNSINTSQWYEVNTHTTALLNDIVIFEDNRIVILGNNGMLLLSEDGGKTFIKQAQPDGKALIAGVWFKEKLIIASDIGIKVLDLAKSK